MYTMQRLLVTMIGAALAVTAGAQALDYQGPPDRGVDSRASAGQVQVDPPARVARLAYLTGDVSFTPAGESDWVQAQVNRPLVAGDKLWTGGSSRVEVQIGSSTIRLDHDSSFDFLTLDDRLAQVELTQGALDLSVRRLNGNESYEIDTPTIAFIVDRVGEYRIDVNSGGYTVVTARRGGGEAVGEGGRRVTIAEGQSVRFNDSQLQDYRVDRIGTPDTFDSFTVERERRYTRAPAHRYVSESVVGYEDLDEYGTWDEAAEYGHVWYPTEVAADWAPYHDGHWAWVDPWGWTWVDNAPWGFAPFHYGRWAYVGSRWGWVPGPLDIEPVYAPALVAFVGGGDFSIGVSLGGPIGWFALGPRDVYFPGYRCGRDYFDRVNYGGSVYINRTVVNNYYGSWSSGRLNYANLNYTNRTAPGALTAMSGSAFVAGQPVRSSAIAVGGTTFANARVLPRAALTPTRDSLLGGRGRAAAPPNAALNRAVIAANRPAAAAPSFAQRQALLQKNAGQPLTTTQLRSLAAHPGNARSAAQASRNVRVVGRNGPAVAASASAGRSANGLATAGAARDGRTSPSRAPEMNRSPAKANAQYLRSAGFAHQGVVPGSERATTANDARARAQAARSERGATVAGNGRAPIERGSRANARLNSATFAHSPNSRAAEARDRSVASVSRGENARASRDRGATTQSTARERSRAITQSQGRSATARERTTFAPQNPRAASRIEQTRRAPELSRSAAADRSARQAAQRVQRSAQQRESLQSRVRAESARSSRPQYSQRVERQAPVQRESRPSFSQRIERQAPVQRESRPSFSQRVERQAPARVERQAPVRREVMQRSEPPRVQQQVTRAPQVERGPRQVARSAPPREQPRGNDKKRDRDDGGH